MDLIKLDLFSSWSKVLAEMVVNVNEDVMEFSLIMVNIFALTNRDEFMNEKNVNLNVPKLGLVGLSSVTINLKS